MTQCICICQLVICDYSRCTLLNYIFGCLLISTGSSYRLADSSMLVGFLSVPRNFLRVLCMSSRSLKPIPESNKVLIWIACYHIIVGCILALNISIRVYNFDNLTKFTILWFVHLNQFSHEYTLVLLHCSLFIGQFFFWEVCCPRNVCYVAHTRHTLLSFVAAIAQPLSVMNCWNWHPVLDCMATWFDYWLESSFYFAIQWHQYIFWKRVVLAFCSAGLLGTV